MNLTARSFRGLSTVSLFLAAPAAAAGQTEFQLQLGKLVDPFAGTDRAM